MLCSRSLTLTVGIAILLAGCAPEKTRVRAPQADAGASLFDSYCTACHASEMGDAPPLQGSGWVKGPEARLIKIVLHGLRGDLTIGGKTYNQEMPAFGRVLSDPQLAALLSYVRRRFGGSAPVATETVIRVRAETASRSEYWRVEELSREP